VNSFRIRRFVPLRLDSNIAVAALHAGELAMGPAVRELEGAVGTTMQSTHVVGVANAFAALTLSLRHWRETELRGKNIALPAVGTCLAMTSAVRAAGLVPVYLDVHSGTASLAPERLLAAYEDGTIDAAVVPRHFGLETGVATITSMRILDDAAQAVLSVMETGAQGHPVVLSLYPSKLLNGIDGGLLLTSDPSLAAAVRVSAQYDDLAADDGSLRMNFKLAAFHARLALASLAGLGEVKAAMATRVAHYDAELKTRFIRLRGAPGDCPQRYVIACDSRMQRDTWIARLHRAGIEAAIELAAIANTDLQRYPNAQRLLNTTFSIPLHPSLTEADQADVIRELLT
jgi:dTDP-4-amino-4,6-dideoxygalactose transaminase